MPIPGSAAISDVFRNVPAAYQTIWRFYFLCHRIDYGWSIRPTIAQYLVGTTNWIGSVGVYLAVLAIISDVAVLPIKEPRGTPLTPEQEKAEEQSAPALAH